MLARGARRAEAGGTVRAASRRRARPAARWRSPRSSWSARSTSSSTARRSRSALALLRHRGRPARLPARQRDHVLGRPPKSERGGRPAGDRAEPRRLARHGADRRRPAAGLTTGFVTRIEQNPALRRSRRRRSRRPPRSGIRSSRPSRRSSAARRGADPGRGRRVTADYGDAQLDALKRSLFAVAILALSRSGSPDGYPASQSRVVPLRSRSSEVCSVA